ncbi:MAG: DUF4845 domain-containing protein [Gammaproteobacteria bacterium]|nr:DUF4845 domain-containing protein [Gammaproteobacteria bacterium]MCP5198378.1 DUF4845 domain-containing protein [Gammaproteobacteria bacterium]
MNRKRQSGLTLTGLIMSCIVIGGGALTGMKLWPIYNEKFKVDVGMDKLAAIPEGSRMNKLALAKELQKQFDVQDVDSLTEAQVRKILQVGTIKGQPGKYATFSYEIRRPFFGHLDIVMNYDKTVQLAGGKTD